MEFIESFSSAVLGALLASGILKMFLDRSLAASLSRILKERELAGRAELEYRQAQIAEFYGPIYSYLESNKLIYPLWLEGKLSEINYDVITMFKAQNDHIIEIITNKAHLIDGNEMPPEFIAFITSSKIWNMYCIRKDAPYIPEEVANLPEVKWPESFETHIHDKTIELKSKLNNLYDKYQIN